MINTINQSTGDYAIPDSRKIITYKLGEYNIEVLLNEKNEFIGIQNISIDKIFYTYRSVKSEFDVAKFYEETE